MRLKYAVSGPRLGFRALCEHLCGFEVASVGYVCFVRPELVFCVNLRRFNSNVRDHKSSSFVWDFLAATNISL